MPKKIYIAGPMRGKPYFNFPEFDKAKERLLSLGYDVYSPADADRAAGFDPFTMPPDYDWKKLPEGEGWDIKTIAKRCCDALLGCDGVYLIPGWQHSTGTQAEVSLAFWIGIPITFHHSSDWFVGNDLGDPNRE